MRKRRSSAAIPPRTTQAACDESACDDAADYEKTYTYDYDNADPAAAVVCMDAVVYHSGQQQRHSSGGNEGGDGNVLDSCVPLLPLALL